MRKRNTRCPVKFPANEHQCESVLYAENTLVHFTGDYVYAIKKNLLETRAQMFIGRIECEKRKLVNNVRLFVHFHANTSTRMRGRTERQKVFQTTRIILFQGYFRQNFISPLVNQSHGPQSRIPSKCIRTREGGGIYLIS